MSSSPAVPNLFIVGAPKCGTTSLAYYLGQHPEVYFSACKEPCYLAPEFNHPSYPQTKQAYLDLFAPAPPQARYRGEATTTYLYSEQAPATIKQLSPDAHIIIMLRNPVSLVASLYGQRVYEGLEDCHSLEQALARESERAKGRQLPKGYTFPLFYLQYQQFGFFSAGITRYRTVFGTDRVHCLLMDDLHNPAACLSDVWRFLDLPAITLADSRPQRPGQNIRGLPLYHALFRPDGPLKHFASSDPMRRKTYHLVSGMLRKPFLTRTKKTISPLLQQTLYATYQDEINKLEELLDRSLSAWKNLP